MKRYIDIDKFKLPCTSEDCHECIFFSLSRCIMKEHINNAPAANVIEVTDMSLASIIKGLEILGDSESRSDIVRCEDCRYKNECHKSVQYTRNELNSVTIGFEPIEWCSRGERREE